VADILFVKLAEAPGWLIANLKTTSSRVNCLTEEC